MRTSITVVALTLIPLLGRPAGVGTAQDIRVQEADLVYQGAFRVPAAKFGGSTFDYGGTALAFNPGRDSLFVVGHDWQQQVAEISIPRVIRSDTLTALETATVLQPFADPTEGKMYKVDDPANGIKVGGLMVYEERLYETAYSYYDGDSSQEDSHFISGLDLSVFGDVRGPYRVGKVGSGFVSGYFAVVPPAWRARIGAPVLNGQCCLSVIGRTSHGPAVFGIDPAAFGDKRNVPATPLVYYPGDRPLAQWDTTNPLFNGSTEIRGVVFPEGTRSVLFFGRHGTGRFCYGEGEACHDPVQPYKGTHGYPYAYYVWAYDADDLTAVKNRKKDPWQVRPYATWALTFPYGTKGRATAGGVAYDSRSGRIFVSQQFAEENLPVIHVFTVKGVSAGA
jgi:hypothetical protein